VKNKLCLIVTMLMVLIVAIPDTVEGSMQYKIDYYEGEIFGPNGDSALSSCIKCPGHSTGLYAKRLDNVQITKKMTRCPDCNMQKSFETHPLVTKSLKNVIKKIEYKYCSCYPPEETGRLSQANEYYVNDGSEDIYYDFHEGLQLYIDYQALSSFIVNGNDFFVRAGRYLELTSFEFPKHALCVESSVFDVEQMLFFQGEEVCFPDAYTIRPFQRAEVTSDNGINLGEYKVFLLCAEHMKCKVEGCNNYVASNGGSIEGEGGFKVTPDELYLNDYCPAHSCGFFWQWENSGVTNENYEIKSYEGVRCTKKAEDGKRFCSDHKCKICDEPVIGVNLVDSRANPVTYQGDNENFYSHYCVKHFCWGYMCKNARSNPNESSFSIDSDGNLVKFTNYCVNDYSGCGISGCSNLVDRSISVRGINLKICKIYADSLIEYDEIGNIKLDADEQIIAGGTRKCYLCGSTVLNSFGREFSKDSISTETDISSQSGGRVTGEYIGMMIDYNGGNEIFLCELCVNQEVNVVGGNGEDLDKERNEEIWAELEEGGDLDNFGNFSGFGDRLKDTTNFCETCQVETTWVKGNNDEFCAVCYKNKNGESQIVEVDAPKNE